jgi:hypothetical protein
MNSDPTPTPGGTTNLLVDIVDTLETCGLERDEYQLHDATDVEALEQFLASASSDVEVQFTVEGIRLVVTPDSVDVLIDAQPGLAEQNDNGN